MMKSCGNCNRSVWIHARNPIPEICLVCRYVSVNGEKEPSNWEPKSRTIAACIRTMDDEKLAEFLVDAGWDCHNCSEHYRLDNEPLLRGEKCDENCAKHCLEWLQEPAQEE